MRRPRKRTDALPGIEMGVCQQIYFVRREHDMLTHNGEQYLERCGKDTKGGFKSQLVAELDAAPRVRQTDHLHESVGSR
jgi:hypothetical protein